MTIPEIPKDFIVAITGPTASGKTRRAVSLARRIGAEIISADSRQVYRGMDLGTGKDMEEYGDVPVHLIDICDAGSRYNLHRFLGDAAKAGAEIAARGRNTIVCGGTGLYLESLLKGMRLPEVPENKPLRARLEKHAYPELMEQLRTLRPGLKVTDVDTAQRAVRAIEIELYYRSHPDAERQAYEPQPLPGVIIGVEIDRDSRRRRITERLDARLDAGMVDEVRRLLDSGIPPENLIYYGLEYKFLTLYCIGQLTHDEMRSGLEIAIHQFAKRQMTWFRGMEQRGLHINWLPYDLSEDEFNTRALEIINRSL